MSNSLSPARPENKAYAIAVGPVETAQRTCLQQLLAEVFQLRFQKTGCPAALIMQHLLSRSNQIRRSLASNTVFCMKRAVDSATAVIHATEILARRNCKEVRKVISAIWLCDQCKVHITVLPI